jgi:hypothetical protein
MHKNRFFFCILKIKANCNSPPIPEGPKAGKKSYGFIKHRRMNVSKGNRQEKVLLLA